MKKVNYIFSGVLILFSSVLVCAQNLPTYVPAAGLVGWWPFSGNANDQSGNTHNGVVNGASLIPDRNGVTNNAYSFDGVSNSITLGNILNVSTQNAITISAWFCPDLLNSLNNEYVGIDIGKKPLNHLTLRLVNSSLPVFQCMHGQPNPANSHYVSVMANNNFTPYVWYHLVAIYKNNEAHLYVNGVEQTNQISSGNTLNTIPANSELYFGKSYVDNFVENHYKGKMDDIGIWNRALSVCEIQELFTGSIISSNSVVPSIVTLNTSNTASFATSASVGSLITWQTNVANTGWHNLLNNSTYSGVTTSHLQVMNLSLQNHLQQFRVISQGMPCSDTSNIAQIYISDSCIATVFDTVHISVIDTNYVTRIDTVTNYISVTDTLIINLLGTTLPKTMNTLKAYPNPAKDLLTIDYGNYGCMPGYSIRIEDANGQVLFSDLIYQQISKINLSSWHLGIYFVYITDAQNTILQVRKIVLN